MIANMMGYVSIPIITRDVITAQAQKLKMSVWLYWTLRLLTAKLEPANEDVLAIYNNRKTIKTVNCSPILHIKVIFRRFLFFVNSNFVWIYRSLDKFSN